MFGVLALALLVTGPKVPPPPHGWLTDEAGVLSEGARARLDEELAGYERKTGHQVIVYLARSTGEVPLEDWTDAAFKAWKVGRESLDDGAALFVFTEDRRARIEVGYGLEAKLTDVAAARILREQVGPKLKAGDAAAAVQLGVDGIFAEIGAVSGPAEGKLPLSPLQLGLLVVAVIGFVLLAWRHPALAFFLLSMIGGRRSRKGFSGGGGRAGGAGASGRW